MVFGLSFPKWKRAEPPPQSNPANLSGKHSSGGRDGALTVNEFVARTKRCKEKGLEPTKPELYAYARYLGIDPFADGDLMWIVDEALKAPLPAEWTEHHDGSERVFYYNSLSHSSSWTHPLEELHRETYKTIVNFRNGGLSKQEQNAELDNMRQKVEQLELETHRELQAWSDHVDEDGQKFFYNREKQRSFWTDPRLAPCHTLYLQMKVLRVLGDIVGRKWVEPLSSDFKRQMKLTSGDSEPKLDKRLGGSRPLEKGELRAGRQEQLVPLSARSTEAPTLSARSSNENASGAEESEAEDPSGHKHKKKKKHHRHKEAKEQEEPESVVYEPERDLWPPGHARLELGPGLPKSPMRGNTVGLPARGPGPGLPKGSTVGFGAEEVRAPDRHGMPAAVSPRHLPPMSARRMGSGIDMGLRGGTIGNLGAPTDEERLQTPRRPKVRPGIKLMPLG